MPFDAATLNRADARGPIEIADRVWWVGSHLDGDPFQCHSYLLEHGDQSVLLDPGGPLVLDRVLEKAARIVDFDDIRWFVCHHQDPDITAGLPRLDGMVRRPDAALVTHWRARALIRHYGLSLPYYLVDEHDWELDLGGRRLRFVFTPYLHFPGAFTTFDEQTGTLFSSDLFGGFTEEWRLVAEDVSYFEMIRPFHEHYMPSREILAAGMLALQRLPIRLIAPQHGELIPEALVTPMIERLKRLECGLYLMVHEETDIRRLSEVHRMLTEALDHLTAATDFREAVTSLVPLVRRTLPATSIEFFARNGREVVHLAPENDYHGATAQLPPEWSDLLGLEQPSDPSDLPIAWSDDGLRAAIPLYSPLTGRARAVAVMRFERPVAFDEIATSALAEISAPLEAAVERELLLRSVELDRQEAFDLAMHDTLTGLSNRRYLRSETERLCALHDRGDVAGVAITLFDLDGFKPVNDTYGHPAGDEVLRKVARSLRANARDADIVARVGGDEFAGVQVTASTADPSAFARRAIDAVQALRFPGELAPVRIGICAGVAARVPHEPVDDAIQRADAALYAAKAAGGNTVVTG